MDGRYSYSITRYVHDIETGEFINVGVVVALCEEPCVAAKFTMDHRRVKGAFPGLDVEVFLMRMLRLQACFDAVDAARCSEVRAREGLPIEALIRSVLPVEDSALHWSPAVSGVCGSLPVLLEAVYRRFIARHELMRRR
ncbi:hypothetical protein H4CHR_05904 [Variovorax sp. PBS-H4]|uniref:DUF3037 domain-containing protein n=1 Tax=Variovorax sp. PBS-H4 TaxID=434008 RepID=UPI0013175AD7|nr:DUF3037 domain-containing protein [Variovorax sp. PBS-H4]VTU41169.1 hypothetical protein H4CHR_05904 [Variovorax sp. PBS-H4]